MTDTERLDALEKRLVDGKLMASRVGGKTCFDLTDEWGTTFSADSLRGLIDNAA